MGVMSKPRRQNQKKLDEEEEERRRVLEWKRPTNSQVAVETRGIGRKSRKKYGLAWVPLLSC